MDNRRDFLRKTVTAVTTGGVIATAGCTQLRGGNSSDAEPTVVGSTDDAESGDGDMDEAAELIRDAEYELYSATETIQTDVSQFSGLTTAEDSAFGNTTDSVIGHTEQADEYLDQLTEHDLTTGQELLVEDLRTVLTGVEELAPVFGEFNNTVQAYNTLEEHIENGDETGIEEGFIEFIESVPEIDADVGNARTEFSAVSEDSLEAMETLTQGRIESTMIDIEDTVEIMTVVRDGFDEFQTAVLTLVELPDTISTESWNTAIQELNSLEDPFEQAHTVFADAEDNIATAYEQELQRFICVSETGSYTSEQFAGAVEAYSTGDTAAAADYVMDGYDAIGTCSYDLLENGFDNILDELLDEAGVPDFT